jgi:hypothetical protein
MQMGPKLADAITARFRHAHNASMMIKHGKTMNFGHLDFQLISRIQSYSYAVHESTPFGDFPAIEELRKPLGICFGVGKIK